LAKGGTVLLDEIAEMPLALQAKLLRVLQERELRPLGADHPVAVDVRVIASTNKDLEVEVAKGSFRRDLFYRLQVIPIVVPPLRARRSDIPLLAHHFLKKTNERYGVSVEISTEAMVHLWEYDWPGNVRQLENMLEQLVILSNNDRIDVEDLPASIGAAKKASHHPSWPMDDPSLEDVPAKLVAAAKKQPNTSWPVDEEGLDLQQALEHLEFRLIDEALRLANGKKSAAAQLLRVKRTTLVAKLRKRRRGLFHAPLAPRPARSAGKEAAIFGSEGNEPGGGGMTDRAEPVTRLGYRRG
jgi:transcriptional regulator with PAS, ATPase and Fis domain